MSTKYFIYCDYCQKEMHETNSPVSYHVVHLECLQKDALKTKIMNEILNKMEEEGESRRMWMDLLKRKSLEELQSYRGKE